MRKLYTQEETQFIIEAAHGSAAVALGQEYAERNGEKFTTAIFYAYNTTTDEDNIYYIHEIHN